MSLPTSDSNVSDLLEFEMKVTFRSRYIKSKKEAQEYLEELLGSEFDVETRYMDVI